MRAKVPLFTLVMLLSIHAAKSQGTFSLNDYNQKMHKINLAGTTALGVWSIGNIAVSSGFLIAGNNSQEDKHFHQFNIAWNAINLGIATFSYISSKKKLQGEASISKTIEMQKTFEKLFLFNSGLDVAYIMTGVFLLERAKIKEENSSILRGFGRSIILQGSFLLVYDAIMYAIHNRHGRELNAFLKGLDVSLTGIGYRYRF